MNTGPSRKENSAVRLSKTAEPVTSPGIKSGVNCTRLESSAKAAARDRTSSVFATPGTPSSSTCPPDSSAMTSPVTARILPDHSLGDLGADGQERGARAGRVDQHGRTRSTSTQYLSTRCPTPTALDPDAPDPTAPDPTAPDPTAPTRTRRCPKHQRQTRKRRFRKRQLQHPTHQSQSRRPRHRSHQNQPPAALPSQPRPRRSVRPGRLLVPHLALLSLVTGGRLRLPAGPALKPIPPGPCRRRVAGPPAPPVFRAPGVRRGWRSLPRCR